MSNEQINMVIGSDPEAGIFDVEQNRVVSAVGVVENNKYNPVPLDCGGTYYHDNALLEFTLKPAESKEELVDNFKTSFQEIQNRLGKRYRIVPKSFFEFTPEECEHPDVREFGCSESFFAWSMQIAEKPQTPESCPYGRSAGCHWHISRKDWKDKIKDGKGLLIDPISKNDIIKMCDTILGLSSAVIDRDPSSVKRKTLYGSAGNLRPKEYGVEYRVGSSFMLSSPKLVEFCWDACQYAVDLVNSGEYEKLLKKLDTRRIQEAINTHDSALSLNLLKYITLPKHLAKQVSELAGKTSADFDFYKEWSIAA